MIEPRADVDAVVVGAGFAGLYAHHRLRRVGLTLQGYEGAADVGGTWWWNRYPGARCDVESMDYSYGFSPELEQEWTWSERYASQPEILRYVDHVADRFDLRRDIRFETRVTAATWDEAKQRWHVETDKGDSVSAQFLIMATGCLSAAKQPEIDGIDTFGGETFHTGRWPHEGVDFTGQRVGVIGTGSSGIQSIPVIAEQAAHLTVFQRTPNFSMPAKNHSLDSEAVEARKARAREIRQAMRESRAGVVVPMPEHSALELDDDARQSTYKRAWGTGTLYGMVAAFNDLLIDRDANETAAEFVRARIHEIVDNPEVAERLSPRNHPFGTKRPCLDSGYYATYNRDNVTLVDVRSTPIVEITPTGVRTEADEYELDIIVFATGFDAMTGPLLGPDITGVGGVPLREKWAAGPRTYLGIATAGFPNLFTITGPGSPSVLVNMMVAIEQHVDWVADCIAYLRERDLTSIDATADAEDAWVDHVNDVASRTLFPHANSWYMGANVPGKPRVFLPYIGGLPLYTETCNSVADDDYRGFTLTPAGTPVAEQSASRA
ncbi:MAG TPA: NAD(P)/FAD-dependent oxidoreductase [Acidimicrobiia bacterium]|nr:NAD(P)/FAD-dependent oxidoreductase [Acidimicrobiia bacterium]